MGALNGTLYTAFSMEGTISTAVTQAARIFSCKNATFKCDIDLPDVSTKDSAGWAQHLSGGGLKTWGIDFDGVWDEVDVATTLSVAEILALIIAGNADRKVAFIPAALGTATVGWAGMGTHKGIQLAAPMEAGMTFAGSIQGNGALQVFTT